MTWAFESCWLRVVVVLAVALMDGGVRDRVRCVRQGDEPARLGVSIVAPQRLWQHQRGDVEIRLKWDRAWFAEHGIDLFRGSADVPCHVSLPWLDESHERAVTLGPAAGADAEVLRVAVGDRIVRAAAAPDEHVDGRAFAVAVVRCRVVPLVSGRLTLAPIELRHAFATTFRDSLLSGRQPVDRQDRVQASAATTIEVAALPEPAPPGFTGAVGEFELTATSGGPALPVGSSFRVELTVTGDGDLTRFRPPPAASRDGFVVQGVVEAPSDVGRRFVLDVLALREGATEMPGVSLVAFSPAVGSYVTLSAPSVPVLVGPLPDGVELDARVQELVEADRAAHGADSFVTWCWRIGLMLLVLLGAAWSRRAVVGRGRRAVQGALHELRVAVALPDADAIDPPLVLARFERLLALVAGGAGADVAFGVPGTWDRLRARGVTDGGVAVLRELHAVLDGARFGGALPPGEAILEAAETLVAAARRR